MGASELDFWAQNFERGGRFLPRKVALGGGRILLKGGAGVGKTALVRGFLEGFERVFYADLDDLRSTLGAWIEGGAGELAVADLGGGAGANSNLDNSQIRPNKKIELNSNLAGVGVDLGAGVNSVNGANGERPEHLARRCGGRGNPQNTENSATPNGIIITSLKGLQRGGIARNDGARGANSNLAGAGVDLGAGGVNGANGADGVDANGADGVDANGANGANPNPPKSSVLRELREFFAAREFDVICFDGVRSEAVLDVICAALDGAFGGGLCRADGTLGATLGGNAADNAPNFAPIYSSEIITNPAPNTATNATTPHAPAPATAPAVPAPATAPAPVTTPAAPKPPHVIITTRRRDLHAAGFGEVELFGLGFEEFIAFFAKNYDAKTLFSQFMRRGNSPRLALFELPKAADSQARLRAEWGAGELAILRETARACCEPLNAYAIYERLRGRLRLSKTLVYATLQRLQECYEIALLPSFEGGRARVFFYDFALKSALDFAKNPKNTIKNMVFCELVAGVASGVGGGDFGGGNGAALGADGGAAGVNVAGAMSGAANAAAGGGFGDLCYTRELDFYSPARKIALKVEPFLDADFVRLWFSRHLAHFRALGVSRVQVISNAGERTFALEGIRCEVLPFWAWSVGS